MASIIWETNKAEAIFERKRVGLSCFLTLALINGYRKDFEFERTTLKVLRVVSFFASSKAIIQLAEMPKMNYETVYYVNSICAIQIFF